MTGYNMFNTNESSAYWRSLANSLEQSKKE